MYLQLAFGHDTLTYVIIKLTMLSVKEHFEAYKTTAINALCHPLTVKTAPKLVQQLHDGSSFS